MSTSQESNLTFITRLRLDAALYEPAPPRRAGQIGRPRLKGERLPNLSVIAEDPNITSKPIAVANWYGKGERTIEVVSNTAVWHSTGLPAVPLRWVLIRDPWGEFETQALLCTDLAADPERIIPWFVMRWQMESTFQEVRQRLRFETQSQLVRKSDPEDRSGTVGAVFAGHAPRPPTHEQKGIDAVRRSAWYDKRHPTFSDALALVRKELWAQEETFCGSPRDAEAVKVPRDLVERLTDALCYAA